MKNRFSAFFLCAGLSLLFPGPTSAQWEQTNGPEGCEITALAAAGPDLFAGTSRHGVFKSTDSGMSWMAVNSGLPLGRDVDLLAVDGTRLFAGIGSKIYRSADGGTNWAPIGPDLPSGKGISCFEVSDGKLLAGTEGGRIYLSTDGGTDWNVTRLRFSNAVFSLVSVGTQVLVISEGDIFVCPDYGKSAEAVKLDLRVESFFLKFVSGGPNLAARARNGSYLIKRTSQGWTADRINFPDEEADVYSFAVSGPNLVAGTDHGAFLSRDDGATWTEVDTSWREDSGVYCLAVRGSSLIAGLATGIFRSEDNGEHWTAANSGFPSESWVSCLAVKGSDLFVSTWGGVSRSVDNGMSWMPVNKGLPKGGRMSGFGVSGRDLYAGGMGRGVYRSSENGDSWTCPSADIDIGAAIATGGDDVIVGSLYYSGISLSKDGGASWVGKDAPGNAIVTCFYMSGSKLYAGTGGSGKIYNRAAVTNSIYLSSDGGLTWKSAKAQFSSSVDCLAVIGTNLFVGTVRGLYLCTDLGDCPAPLKLKLSREISVTSLVTVGTDLYVGTGSGVLLVRNKGKNWTAVDTGMREKIAIICLARTEAYLFAGTQDQGVWRLPLAELKSKSDAIVKKPGSSPSP